MTLNLQQLLATAKQARPTSKFDEIRSEIVTWLSSDFAANLKPASSMVFHEIFYAGSQVQSKTNRHLMELHCVAISY